MNATASLVDLMKEAGEIGHYTPEYYERMIHKIPQAKVVDRVLFILSLCKGKRVVNFGCASGLLHENIKMVAKSVFGIDKVEPADLLVDLDDEFAPLYDLPETDIFVCGEIVEHLSNPGLFLRKLKKAMKMNRVADAKLVITVPNALASVLQQHAKRGIMNVNADHVNFYTYTTMKELLRRYEFRIEGFYYYEGVPVFAEGLIVVAR